MKHKKKWQKFLLCIVLFIWTPLACGVLFWKMETVKTPKWEYNADKIRNFEVIPKRLDGFQKWGENDYEQFAKDFLYSGSKYDKASKPLPLLSWYGLFLPKETEETYHKGFRNLLCDIKCFPVEKDTKERAKFTFENSWGMSRNYGGKRIHEGTDIMPAKNKRNYYEVVSVCDGVVEKIGWLNLGGYRIGIRSSAGTYFYYAHLSSYGEKMQIGKKVKAGEILGFMGDSGYGKEGTVGKFPVHLHFGIYLKIGQKEQSVNPYPILKAMEMPLSTE